MSDALPHIINAPGLTRAQLIREVQRGARLVVFPMVVSFGVTIVDDGPARLLRRGDPPPSARRRILTSLLFGWWGITGISSTLRAVRICRTGGHDVTDHFFTAFATARILRLGRPGTADEPTDDAALDEAVPGGDLPASGPATRPVRPIVLAALTAITLPALVVLAVRSDSPTRRVDELDVADCFDLPEGDTVTTVRLRSCDERHDAQLLADLRLDDETLAAPDDERSAAVLDRCRIVAEDLGIDEPTAVERSITIEALLPERGVTTDRRLARCYLASDRGLLGSLVPSSGPLLLDDGLPNR